MMTQREARERVDHWSRVVAQQPDSAAANFNLGLACTAFGAIKRAEAAYRRALELDPAMVEAWVNLGGVRLLLWDFQAALDANVEALKLDPDCLLAHYNAGQAYLYLANAEGVVAANRRVVEMQPAHGAGHYFLAVGLLAAAEVAPARAHLAEALRLGYHPEPEFLKAIEQSQEPPTGEPAVLEIGT
jgi:protein O-GlcNAc transferase